MTHAWKVFRVFSVILIWGFVSWLGHSGHLSFFDAAIEDALWFWRWKTESNLVKIPRIFVFPIDAYSIRKFSQEKVFFPFPREIYAEAIRQLESLGISVVGFDIFFPNETSNEGIREFSRVMASSSIRVVLAASLDSYGRSLNESFELPETEPQKSTELFERESSLASASENDNETYEFMLKEPIVLTEPNPDLAGHAKLGLINCAKNVNLNEVIRKHPLTFPYLGREFPTLPLTMYLVWKNIEDNLVVKNYELCLSDGKKIPLEPVETSSEPNIKVNYLATPIWKNPSLSRGESTSHFHFASFYDLVRGKAAKGATVDREFLRGAVALIGVSSDFGADTIPIPGNSQAAGIVLHTSMFDALSTENGFMRRLDLGAFKYLSDFVFFIMCFWIMWTQRRFNPFSGVFFAFVAPILLILCTAGLFNYGYKMHIGSSIVGFPIILFFVYFLGYLLEGRKKTFIYELFSKQVSQEVVLELIEDAQNTLVPKRQEISVSFIDICDFTSFSERHSPERVLVQLNHYFSRLIKIVHKNRVRLDKFIGDAKTVLEMKEEVEKINKNLPKGFDCFSVRYGINSGEAILGNVGSIERMEYTVTGDTVNLASRLQAKAKSHEIIMGVRTQELVQELVEAIPLEPIQIAGKSAPVKAYRLVGLKDRKEISG
ncbi:adenylate/guanylate cyclase domain-containing protein [bacterium]|nr:adenylate/guanylate cyclase domain-containing protein [bacterium]